MRRISILGATGSIGQSTIDLISRASEKYKVVALTGGRNIQKLANDAKRLKTEVAVTAYDECFADLKTALSGTNIKVAAGSDALIEAAQRPADWCMSAIVGAAGLAPGWAALKQGQTLALANKESLVTAGPLLLAEAEKHRATIVPVDSEHSGIFQALAGENIDCVERIIITASGGAFRDWPLADLAKATPAQAATHPNWNMGQRITIDSASMFNKAMELIETKEFFKVSPDKIETVIHPESLIHAIVGFNDGGMIAHVGPADMRHAIGYALHWPDRGEVPVERLDLIKIGQFTFREAEDSRYPVLKIARDVMNEGGLTGAVFNAAKESALDAFIDGKIGFMDMAPVVAAVLDKMSSQGGLQNAGFSLDDVLETDQIARIRTGEIIKSRSAPWT